MLLGTQDVEDKHSNTKITVYNVFVIGKVVVTDSIKKSVIKNIF